MLFRELISQSEMTTVTASGLTTIPLQKSRGFRCASCKIAIASRFWGLASKSQEACNDYGRKSPQPRDSRPQRPRDTKSLSSAPWSASSAEKSVSSLSKNWHTNNRLTGTHWALSPELGGEGQKAHWARCVKPYSPEPYSARFRLTVAPRTQYSLRHSSPRS